MVGLPKEDHLKYKFIFEKLPYSIVIDSLRSNLEAIITAQTANYFMRMRSDDKQVVY